MGHEETIRIYRSDVLGAEPPSLTYGELAANLADRKVFVGGTGGTANMLVLLESPVIIDTVLSGIGIDVVGGPDNKVIINNTGVLSLNGLTGARTLTGDGGALAGVGNANIAARLATASLTGVASFPAADFNVVAGAVSLTGNLARTNVGNVFTAFQFFPQGFNTAKGVTFAAGAAFASVTEPVNMQGNLNVAGNISASNFLSWETVATNKGLSPYRGVFANKSPASGQLVLTIESASSSTGVGTMIEVSGLTGSWRILIPNNHTVHFGNVTVAGSLLLDGFLESTHHRDSIRMVCYTKSGSTSQWNVLSSVGIINYGTESALGVIVGEIEV